MASEAVDMNVGLGQVVSSLLIDTRRTLKTNFSRFLGTSVRWWLAFSWEHDCSLSGKSSVPGTSTMHSSYSQHHVLLGTWRSNIICGMKVELYHHVREMF